MYKGQVQGWERDCSLQGASIGVRELTVYKGQVQGWSRACSVQEACERGGRGLAVYKGHV